MPLRIATILRGAKSVSRFARPPNWRRLALRSYVLTTLNIKLSRAQADDLLSNDGGNK